MQAVCETMPSAIPSLVLCLQTLKYFNQGKDAVFAKTKELTKCDYDRTITGFIMDPTNAKSAAVKDIDLNRASNLYKCDFPGSDAYNWLLNLRIHITKFEQRDKFFTDVLNKFNLKNNFFNTMVYDQALQTYKMFQDHFEDMKQTGEVLFDKYFYGDFYVELINVYIVKYIDLISEKLDLLKKTEVPNSAVVRPLEKISQSLV
jgi:hypothetical protein